MKLSALNAFLFVVLGVPGLGVMLFGIGRLLRPLDLEHAAISGLLFVVGSVMALIGVRREREPLYLLVLWAFPAGIVWWPRFLPWIGGGLFFEALRGGFAAALVLVCVRSYYRHRDRRLAQTAV